MRPDLTPYELIRHLANKDTQTGDITETLEDLHDPMTPSALAEHHSIKRRAVSDFTAPLEPWAVERSEDGARTLTAAGEATRRAYAQATEDISADKLAWLSRSESRGDLLTRLRTEGPADPRTMARDTNGPHRETVSRAYKEFEEYGWVTSTKNRVASLTIDGEEKSRVYDDLITKMEQVIHKAPCLRDLGIECGDIPLTTLADADIVEATPEYPLKVQRAARDISKREFQYLRAFQSYWQPETEDAFRPHIKEGKQFELVSYPFELKDIPRDPKAIKFFAESLEAENFEWLMYSEKLPCSLAILDTDFIAIGPRDPGTANQTRVGTIFSENDEFIEWGLDFYERYRSQSKDPFEHSFGFSLGVEELTELLYDWFIDDGDDGDDTTDTNSI